MTPDRRLAPRTETELLLDKLRDEYASGLDKVGPPWDDQDQFDEPGEDE